VIEASKEDIENRRKRAQTMEQLDVLPTQEFVGHSKQAYATQPLNEFQRRLRSRLNNGSVLNHVVPSKFDRPVWGNKMSVKRAWTEQICNIPFDQGADYRNLPPKLKSWGKSHPNSAAAKNKFYPGIMGRLGLDEPSNTLLTKLTYADKGTKVLKFMWIESV